MWLHAALSNAALFRLIHTRKIQLGGNKPGKIFGLLSCKSGKRMKRSNRVFFQNAAVAIKAGYRPCAHCMPHEYQLWKKSKEDL